MQATSSPDTRSSPNSVPAEWVPCTWPAPPRLSRNQALKVLDSALGADPSFRDRFRREAQLAARLDHPNIVAVHDAGVDDSVMWIAMQYIEGTDAAELLRTAPAPLPADQAVDIIAQAGAGLDHAHAFGMLHRDVKPANILVAENIGPRGRPRVLVADFGVARLLDDSAGLTETGMVVGTLAYAAPEMFAAAELTPALDIYALGCVLYELLTVEQVFTGRDALALVNAHGTTPPPRVTALRPDLPRPSTTSCSARWRRTRLSVSRAAPISRTQRWPHSRTPAGPRSSPTTRTRREHRQWTSASTRPLRPPTTAPRRRHSSPTPGHALPCRPQPTRARRKRFSPEPGTGLPRRPRTARPGHNPCPRPSATDSTRTPRRRRLRIPPCTASRPRMQRHPRTPGPPARNRRAAETRCRTFSRAARCCSSSRSSRSARCT